MVTPSPSSRLDLEKTMTVLLIGATGRTGRFIAHKLSQARIPFRVLIRNPQQQDDLTHLGAEVVVQNLNTDFHHALKGIDTVIYAAGSAETEGAAQEQQIDRDAIIKTADYARQQGIQRLILISALVATDASYTPEALQHYVEMKREADDYVIGCGLNFVLLRPGPLTMEPAQGTIKLTDNPARNYCF
jgi:uncharacterized protein YbjT (DUF2867 family)